MKEKLIEMCLLLDVYGKLLTQKQHDLMDFYYNEDLSLGEIAENLGISRQGVRDGLVHAEEALRDYEEKLMLVDKITSVRDYCTEIAKLATDILECNQGDTKITALAEAIKRLSDETTSKMEL